MTHFEVSQIKLTFEDSYMRIQIWLPFIKPKTTVFGTVKISRLEENQQSSKII